MPQQIDGQNLIKFYTGPDNYRTELHSPHHLLDTTASADFVSWQRTEIVKNSASISKCRLLINFNFLLAPQGKSEQGAHNVPHTLRFLPRAHL